MDLVYIKLPNEILDSIYFHSETGYANKNYSLS